VIKTGNGQALVQLDPGAFLEPTVISISRLADAFQLTNFDGNQFPPKYDYDAVNSSGTHVLQTGKFAIVAFCLLSLESEGVEGAYPAGGYPENRRIGHNPVAGAPGFPFEVLDPVDLEEEGLADDLNCPTEIGSLDPGGSGFAHAALRAASRYLAPILLPRQLWAATLIKLPPPPPIGGRAGSLSPFGVVEFSEGELEFATDGDPGGQEGILPGTPIEWGSCPSEACHPRVRLVDGEGSGVGNATITAELFRFNGETYVPESFGGGSEDTEVTLAEGDDVGVAEFDQLIVSGTGTYQLRFSADGVTPIASGNFSVGD
jgi:hypothetical protein